MFISISRAKMNFTIGNNKPFRFIIFFNQDLIWGNFINTMLYKWPWKCGFDLGTKLVELQSN